MRVRIEVSGDKDLMASITRLGEAGETAAKVALDAVAKRIVPAAQSLAPVEEVDGGALRDSIRSTRPTRGPAGIVASIVAGGAPLLSHLKATHHDAGSEVYAFIQHEDLTLKHTQGEAKFVEKAVLRHADEIPGLVLEALDKVAARG